MKGNELLNLEELDYAVMEGPAVEYGIMEDDFYKFPMGQFITNRPDFANARVNWRFKNRTKGVALGEHISEKDFGDQIDLLKKNQLLNSQGHHYLRGTFEYDQGNEKQMFSNEYLKYLCNDFAFPTFHFSINDDRQLDITWVGKWRDSSAGELPVIKIVNTLYYRSLMSTMSRAERYAVYAQGMVKLHQKVKELKEHPNVMFSDFGNRRRFGGNVWQRYVDTVMAQELPKQFWGTSNTQLAMELGLRPIGTCAHEISMIITACMLDSGHELGYIQNWIQEEWNRDWGFPLAICLPDTYGTPFCLESLSDETVRNLKGFRADSMDPMDVIPLYIERFRKAGVDPRDRMAIPSDGLTVPEMIRISDAFAGQINISHGLGTHLTNDMGLPTLSIVGKADMVSGASCVKLSDNVAKATGDPYTVKRYIVLAGYTNEVNIAPTV